MISRTMVYLSALVMFGLFIGALTQGCSSGPQIPLTATPMDISCTWNIGTVGGETTDPVPGLGNLISNNDCLIDRSSADARPRTTGVRTDADTDVDLDVAP